MSLTKSKVKPRRIAYDWGAFREEQELQMKYTVEVRNRFSALCGEDKDCESEASMESATRRYEYFTTVVA